MDIHQIETALSDIFHEPLKDGESRKLVFWLDKDNEFAEDINQISVDGVKIHQLTDHNQFYTKYLLEEEEPSTSFLIYTNLDLEMEENWLADTVLYSKTFYADKISLILSDLHIDPSLRATIKKYEKFFNNKERFKKFADFGIENYTEEMIELAIMSVLCNVKTPDFEDVLKSVLMDSLDEKENKSYRQLDKFFNVDVFWRYVEHIYGYEREEKTLKTLFIHLVVTAFSQSVGSENLADLSGFIAQHNKTNALVFIDHWMHHKTDDAVFDEYTEMVEQEIQLPKIINTIPVDTFKQADIFPYIDKAIIIHIANGLFTDLEDYEEYTKLIKLRRAKHYYGKFSAIYEALYYTVKMQEFYKEHRQGIPQGHAIDLYERYIKEYYRMDTYYRKFYVAFDKGNNHDLMKKLKDLVEDLYTNWYMEELNILWSKAAEAEMIQEWSLPGIKNQQHFYSSVIAPKLRNGERVFILVSDAMRYEIGVELAERLNAETMGSCEMETMLSVLPSITKLGMPALLPHREIDIDINGNVYVDGMNAVGFENRKKIIESKVSDSIAVHFQDILAMNKTGRRETFKGKKLIFIYHDHIDAVGDKAATERYTFDAVEKALNQLFDLVKIIRGDLSGTNVYITSDHGFLYQRDALEESDKIGQDKLDAIEVKRRYILAKEQRDVQGQLAVNLSSIIKNEQQLTAYIPKANLRYKMQGSGINFVHGGASLQEVVVPLLSWRNKRSGQKGAKAIQKVDIKLTNTARKITNSIFNLEFFQTEKVGDKMTPRTVVIYMADEAGNVLSNEETIIGDRSFDNPADRTFKIRFVLKNMAYDRNQTYYLIIKDTETGIAVEKIPFTINLGIVSDFDF
ncbi:MULTISPECIES: BREX-1 system phosphatase PglZ type A [Heyndrickxia]|uniref:BREX-1 system phosphatase PglZ type A n=1 Tax=Heyndrickxia TaxID=2837504 RepID=UPI002DB6F822|nr:BREX-1 system phosphatase PglZ type A [Weizmannia sp. CD-2023]MEC2303581.1 BREX-1 system phosphatase PglZ type A [Weizmannia sp. CD-2023]MEC2340511.1 BREX-1 system phosphatase PglZ type A [Weizmannia sp. CD-2023]